MQLTGVNRPQAPGSMAADFGMDRFGFLEFGYLGVAGRALMLGLPLPVGHTVDGFQRLVVAQLLVFAPFQRRRLGPSIEGDRRHRSRPVFLIPWAVTYKELLGSMGWIVIAEMLVFIGILFTGYIYAWRRGGLDWD